MRIYWLMESTEELNHGKGRNMAHQEQLELGTLRFSRTFSLFLTSAAFCMSASFFSLQTSWFGMAGHMAADSSCVLHFTASKLERDFLFFLSFS